MSRLGSIVGLASAANLYCPDQSDFQIEGGVSWQGNSDGAGWTITGFGAVRGKTSFNMIGGYMEFDLDNDRATTGMNNNLYTISPSHQYNSFNDYCDAQGPDGSSPTGTNCIEMDIWEANGNCAVQAAWHTWFNKAGDCDRDGCAVEADIGGKIHVRADFGIDGEMHIYYDGKEMTDYHPKPSNAAKQSVADTFNAVGATIVSTQWYGWGPHESKCKDNGNNPGSSFSISNLKVSGTVLMGPTPSRCSGSPTPPSPTPCTAANRNPWVTGSEVLCCDGLQTVLKNWDGDGNYYYKCVATPSPTPEPTPSPRPSPPPPTPKPTPAPPTNQCPDNKPSQCVEEEKNTGTTCNCVQGSDFHFYKCGDTFCNNICSGCHAAAEETMV